MDKYVGENAGMGKVRRQERNLSFNIDSKKIVKYMFQEDYKVLEKKIVEIQKKSKRFKEEL